MRDGWFPYKTCNIVANFTKKNNQLENYLDYRLNTHIGWKPLKLFIRDKNEQADGKLLHVGNTRSNGDGIPLKHSIVSLKVQLFRKVAVYWSNFSF